MGDKQELLGDAKWKSYEAWQHQVPTAITSEKLWQFFGYRKALFLYDICWRDCENLLAHPIGKAIAQQMIRSAGSISANIEEGRGRKSPKEYRYFLHIALGSARETKGWYYRAQRLLNEETLNHRLALLSEIIALLITEIQRYR